MFTAVLISPGNLPADVVADLHTRWTGDDPRWLAPGKAAEIALAALPQDADQVWRELQERQIDLAFIPAEGRRKRLLIADMDSTMIEQECIDELADEAGVGAQVAAITARAMNGEIGFEGALRERVVLMKGLPEETITHVLETRITTSPGGRELVATMKAHGAHAALVSGGFSAFASPIARRLGFDESRANLLLASDGILTGEVAKPILGQDAKVTALHDLCERLGMTPEDALAVGDGMNDLPMLQAAGMGVALHGKPALQERVGLRINHADLTALLFLQGYTSAEFVS